MLPPLFPVLITLSSLITQATAIILPSPTHRIPGNTSNTNAPAPTATAVPIITRKPARPLRPQQLGANRPQKSTSVLDNAAVPISVCGYLDLIVDNVHFNQDSACAEGKWCGTDG
ncbi:hypothetical protein E2P81_ATG10118 [Venturia nashicola]|uniref:Uncharacterized protein n=1 Tax=Venturia nashicola TaxID=86259 RepID=A0A4Z1NQQ2_9PEZI|nr:hypothetical protein E6O75_ATG10338 [Venturia nashicola]TLD14577.1 hypothetical protein E2P81_ATG10118 [Venturia nashicola]